MYGGSRVKKKPMAVMITCTVDKCCIIKYILNQVSHDEFAKCIIDNQIVQLYACAQPIQ